MGKLPGFMFYPGDWMKDPELRRCSKAAKGVWMDMLAMMFECADRGVFSTGGMPWTDQEISAAIGGDIAENLTCLEELLRKGVAHRNGSGAIFSARMVRDQQTRVAERDKKRNQRNVPIVVPPHVPPLSVSEDEDVTGSSKKEEKFVLPIWVPEKAWLAFIQMRTQKKEPPTELAKKRLVMKLEDLMNEGNNPEMVIWESVMNGWKGFFALKNRDIGKVRAATIPQERPTW